MSGGGDVSYQLYIGGEIDDEMAGALITQMAEFHDSDPTAYWDVVINCAGGSVEAGSAVAMVLRSYSERGGGEHYITTIATGQCSSMATLISQMGDWRVTDRLCVWMFHEPVTTSCELPLSYLTDDLAIVRRWNEVADEFTLERTTLSARAYRAKVKGRNWFVLSEELLALGFVDEVRK